MSILILTEGGREYGFGHITRCMAIYQAIEEITNSSEFIVNGDDTIHDLLKEKNYRIFDWLNSQQQLLEGLKKTDTVFIDSYLAESGLYEEISNRVQTSVFFDDMSRLNYPKGVVVNGGVFAEQLRYPEKKNVTYLLGSGYAPLRKEFWSVDAKHVKDQVETVLITFGGVDTHNLAARVLSVFRKNFPNLYKIIIVGSGFKRFGEIKHVGDLNTKLFVSPTADEIKNLMLKSDIGITAGGQTLYEFARTGTAAIGICVADNQLENVKMCHNLGFLKYIGWFNSEDLEPKLIGAVEYLSDPKVRMDMSIRGRETIDGQGSRRVVDRIRAI